VHHGASDSQRDCISPPRGARAAMLFAALAQLQRLEQDRRQLRRACSDVVQRERERAVLRPRQVRKGCGNAWNTENPLLAAGQGEARVASAHRSAPSRSTARNSGGRSSRRWDCDSADFPIPMSPHGEYRRGERRSWRSAPARFRARAGKGLAEVPDRQHWARLLAHELAGKARTRGPRICVRRQIAVCKCSRFAGQLSAETPAPGRPGTSEPSSAGRQMRRQSAPGP